MREDCLKIIDGITYTADMRILLQCDQDREGEVAIPEGVLFIKVSDPTLRAYLISSLPDTKENNTSLQI